MEIARDARIGLVLKGGPVNGVFAAVVASESKKVLDRLGLKISGIYANSATVPAGVMSSVDRDDECCEIWSGLTPLEIIGNDRGWLFKVASAYRLLTEKSIFPNEPLRRILRDRIPLDRVFSPEAIPMKFMTVDFWSGEPMIFFNKNPEHKDIWIDGVDASMGLVPFRGAVQVGKRLLFDGGYYDNLMLDEACRDGMDVILAVDINEMQLGPLESKNDHYWANLLLRAMQVLVKTNDSRRLHGVVRTNEVLAVRDQLTNCLGMEMPDTVRAGLKNAIERMNNGLLDLHDKHKVQIITIGDRQRSIPFDFASFHSEEIQHLIQCGRQAAQRALDGLTVAAAA